MYDRFFHAKMDINSFTMNPLTSETIKGFIHYFYGNNDSYYRNRGKLIDPSQLESLELQSFVNLFNNRGEGSFDERYSAIEVISKTPTILADSVIAVIAPVDFKAKHAKVLQSLRDGNVDIIPYNTFGGAPCSYNGVIRDKLYVYLCQKGIINASREAM